jgi:2-polyprenyl-3-methyl-5-hydroxy-6-metoxy-1,4-benzoquinol methylase
MTDKTEARRRAGQLFQEAISRGDVTSWFEQLYSGAEMNPDAIPWADMEPNVHLAEWLEREKPNGSGKTAVVIGCGLGDDAEALARRGFTVTAFDISAAAIDWCKTRWTDTRVNYTQADLFALPQNWAFDFVGECYTVQALPLALRQQAIAAVAALVAPGGRLLAIGRLVSSPEEQKNMPWPLTPAELDRFKQAALSEIRFEDFVDAGGMRRFRAEYQR